MKKNQFQNQILDVRPDRLDLRDREYRPPLKNLPSQYPNGHQIDIFLNQYMESGMVLDQKSEGACTGFGLAAVINYLRWVDNIQKQLRVADMEVGKEKEPANATVGVHKVSERMLYHLAKIYDEWKGEDYDGSSCRGAMKGWHKHGVCDQKFWPYLVRGKPKFKTPEQGWAESAAKNPIGAYYRINKDSVADMQFAIVEVGAIYCSSRVHDGWFNLADSPMSAVSSDLDLPIIKGSQQVSGAHAFALVGYNEIGFILQNSWGEDWGVKGFAILLYEDWVAYGMDAWVAVRGAATSQKKASAAINRQGLQHIEKPLLQRMNSSLAAKNGGASQDFDQNTAPWTAEKAHHHTVILGNNGRPMLNKIVAKNANVAVEQVVRVDALAWLQEKQKPKVMIYAHGGLNSESDSIERIQVLAPYFQANGIYPIFISWRTGVLESSVGVLEDFISGKANMKSDWSLESISNWVQSQLDRSIELGSHQFGVKRLWDEMKQNAHSASKHKVAGAFGRGTQKGGMVLIAEELKALKEEIPDLEIHVVGHSAGSILIGYWLEVLGKRSMKLETLTLLAPACSVDFANKYYRNAVEKKILAKNRLFLDILSDERELADEVGPYKKSLLYLVCRALEDMYKMPILGMEASWNPDHPLWKENQDEKSKVVQERRKQINNWLIFAKSIAPKVNNPDREIHDKNRADVKVTQNEHFIKLRHGSFDNDIYVITKILERIKGAKADPIVDDLKGF